MEFYVLIEGLGRNPLYISSLISYMRDVLINAVIIRAFPRILRP